MGINTLENDRNSLTALKFSNSEQKQLPNIQSNYNTNDDSHYFSQSHLLKGGGQKQSQQQLHQHDQQLYEIDLDVSTANNNSIVILLNNQDVFGSIVGRTPNGGAPHSEDLSQETVIPSLNQDPPVTLEEALFLVSGDPVDKYAIKNMYIIINLLSMFGFMVPLSMIFMFNVPKLECYNDENKIYFRCSQQQACSAQYVQKYRQVYQDSINSFISEFNMICSSSNLFDSRQQFAIISSILMASQLLSGFLLDKFGRKKVIMVKIIGFLVAMIVLMIVGFIPIIGFTLIFSGLFIKYTYESVHHILASTGQVDSVKYLLNQIARDNDEDIFTDKIAFTLTPQQIKRRRGAMFMLKNLFGSKQKLIVVGVLAFSWLCYATGQMVGFVFIENIQSDVFLDLIILSATEFMAALSTKIIVRFFRRRTAILLANIVICLLLFFLIILKGSPQTHYIVSISSRAALQILSILLTLTTLETFPTEIRALAFNICFSLGMLGGISLPFINGLSTELLIVIIMIFVTSSIGLFFIRETKNEEQLRNIYTEIFTESEKSNNGGIGVNRKKSSEQVGQSRGGHNSPKNIRQVSIFENIMNELKGAEKGDDKFDVEKDGLKRKFRYDKNGLILISDPNDMLFEKEDGDGPESDRNHSDGDELHDSDYFDEDDMNEGVDVEQDKYLQNSEFEDDLSDYSDHGESFQQLNRPNNINEHNDIYRSKDNKKSNNAKMLLFNANNLNQIDNLDLSNSPDNHTNNLLQNLNGDNFDNTQQLDFSQTMSNISTTRGILLQNIHSRDPSSDFDNIKQNVRGLSKKASSSNRLQAKDTQSKYMQQVSFGGAKITQLQENKSVKNDVNDEEGDELTVGEIDGDEGLDQQYDRLNNI
eukprot:403331012